MSTFRIPKPAKRGRKTRKPIRAKGRKRTSNRRKEQLSLKKQCAILWARWIKRNERCEFIGFPIGRLVEGSEDDWVQEVHLQCGGNLQAMHGFGKKAYPGVRYAAWNGFCGCAKVHVYFTWRPPEWENYLRGRWGEEQYQSRLREAMQVRKYDLSQVVQTYRAALAGASLPEVGE